MDTLTKEVREATEQRFSETLENNVRIFGIPSGYEYANLIEAIGDASNGSTNLTPKTIEALKSLEKPIHIQTFVTPTCPYCTTSVRLVHIVLPHKFFSFLTLLKNITLSEFLGRS